MNSLCHILWIPILHVLNASTIFKHINITTPESYGRIELLEYCITPTADYSFKFEVRASDNAWVDLVTDNGTTGIGYQIGIGANDNKRCDIRRGIPSDDIYVEWDNIDDLLESTQYRAFWISWRDGIIEVGRGLSVRNTSSRFIIWSDPEPLAITGLFLSSKNEGSFIVHYPTGNTAKYTKASGKRGGPVLLSYIVGHHVIECAARCHQDSKCINFNFKESSNMCKLLQARPSEATDDSLYNFYSQC